MARNIRSPKLETRSNRLKLPVRKKPYRIKIDRGIEQCYRRNRAVGSWGMRVTRNGQDWTKKVGVADDFEDADGDRVLTFWQAQAKIRQLALGERETKVHASKPATVATALDDYETDLVARGADTYNARRCRIHIPDSLANEAVAQLTARGLREWRNGLLKQIAAPSVVRTCRAFKAALNLSASHDPRITNSAAWRIGLAALPDAERADNVILPDEIIRAIIVAAWDLDPELGLFVEVIATTGARPSQVARLLVGDLRDHKSAPQLAMPTSKKGKRKTIRRYLLPIPASLAIKLRSSRPAEEPLLLRRAAPWRPYDHRHPFAAAVKRVGLDPTVVTIYALRHSSIVRQLLSAIAIRVVAMNHDTGIEMIECNYSKHISDVSDALTRRAMLELAAPNGDKVVPISAGA